MIITVRIDDTQVKTLLTGIRERAGNLRPAMAIIGEIVRSSVIKNFAVGGRPKWATSQRVEGGGLTLVNTGRLRNSITARATATKAVVGTNVVYAAIHQLGGDTKPHDIRPRKGKALMWLGAKHPVKGVRHPGSHIPARPFLAVQDEDWAEIRAALGDYLLKGKQ